MILEFILVWFIVSFLVSIFIGKFINIGMMFDTPHMVCVDKKRLFLKGINIIAKGEDNK